MWRASSWPVAVAKPECRAADVEVAVCGGRVDAPIADARNRVPATVLAEQLGYGPWDGAEVKPRQRG